MFGQDIFVKSINEVFWSKMILGIIGAVIILLMLKNRKRIKNLFKKDSLKIKEQEGINNIKAKIKLLDKYIQYAITGISILAFLIFSALRRNRIDHNKVFY